MSSTLARFVPLAVAAGLAGCSAVEPVDPFLVRGAVRVGYAAVPDGLVRAVEGRRQGPSPGDDVRFNRDLGLDPAPAYGLSLEGRPGFDDEVRVDYLQVDFRGEVLFDRPRRFDGQIWGPSEIVAGAFQWRRYRGSYAHRVVALREQDDVPHAEADVLVRAGLEHDVLHADLSSGLPKHEARECRPSGPFLGLDARAAVLEGVVLRGALDGGYYNFRGVRLGLFDASAGVRLSVWGPFDLDVGYDLAIRDAGVRYPDGEYTRADFTEHTFGIEVGLRY